MGLTASDGTGLALVRYEARAVVSDPVALTELHLEFENPEDRTLEGTFRITLPENAKLSRFAMKVGEHWQEGEVLEKQQARRTYEDYLHRKQDPALLEQAAGNEFSARVFPIPARGKKELILSYSEEIEGTDDAFRLRVLGLPTIKQFAVSVDGDFGAPFALRESQFKPQSDILVPLGDGHRRGRLHGNLAIVRVPLEAAPEHASVQEIESLSVLLDASASRALGWQAQLDKLEQLIDALVAGAGAQIPLLVMRFDQSQTIAYQGTAGGFGASERAALRAHLPLGASDLEAALRALSPFAKQHRRVWLVSDGVATAGALTTGALADAAKALVEAGVSRIDALAAGGIRNREALASIVAPSGTVIDADQDARSIADHLTRPSMADLAVVIEQASFVWPKSVSGRQVGDELLVFAELEAAAKGDVVVRIGERAYRVPRALLAEAPAPLMQRALAGSKLQALSAERDLLPDDAKEQRLKLTDAIISTSIASRVLCADTALLVLETEADYAQHKIDRSALGDILQIEQGRITVAQRRVAEGPAGEKPPPQRELERSMARPAEPLPVTPASGDSLAEEAKSMADAPSAPVASPRPAALEEQMRAASGRAQPRSDRGESQPRPSTPHRSRRLAPCAACPPGDPLCDPTCSAPERRVARDELETLKVEPYAGSFGLIMAHLQAGKHEKAHELAVEWRTREPADVLALIALGEVYEAQGKTQEAARAYGSLIDLFPNRADLRRFAGERLDRLALTDADALALAVDTYRKAVEQRPDHPASHRLLAFALLRKGLHEEAFAALEQGLKQRYPDNRFRGVLQILQEDAGLIAAAWKAAEPTRAQEITERLERAGGKAESAASTRFVLVWETDANDVDFHIYDNRGGHAYYANQKLASGGELYADVTTGYGPECFTIRGGLKAAPYRLEAHYYSRGPMGYGMGKVEIIGHDGHGKLTFDERPFVVMNDRAYIKLGQVR